MGDCGDFVPYAHFSTQAIHVGSEPEQWNSRAVVPPISLATTFKQDEPGKQIAVCTVFTTVSWTTVSFEKKLKKVQAILKYMLDSTFMTVSTVTRIVGLV